VSTISLLDFARIRQVVDVCLCTATEPLSAEQLALAFDNNVAIDTIKQAITELETEYSQRGLELVCLANGYRLRSKLEYQEYLNKIYSVKPAKYSRAVMETIAIIAYRQPITRHEIEDIRGVTLSSNIIQTLIEREWIESVGHKEVPGRPELLATTNKFLEDLGLSALNELPELPNISVNDIDEPQHLIAPLQKHME